ncbi:MAG TPA: carboxypeptidase-like regulatory domain-containing protein [Bryobacteraceae bacterium]|nr:carboxypeptidase-like regulatory domain-containing protein [Bryobacteraceae bacterium]
MWRVIRSEAGLAALLCAALPVFAEERGQADIALQGYYSGGTGESASNLTGVAAHYSDLLPRLGILDASIEATGYGNQVKTGDNFLGLRGVPWRGRRWSFTGGDYRVGASLIDLPVTNLYYPDLSLRGVKVEAASGRTRYSVFWGQQTLLEGPRVPFRAVLPQSVLGAAMRRELGRLSLGARLLRFRAHPSSDDDFLFPPGRRFESAGVAALQASYAVSGSLKLYGELTGSRADTVRSTPFSQTAGATWETSRVTVRLNWARQGKLYYPAAGYFAGDRAGPFGELRVRPWRRVELFGSASRYRNNLERDSSVPNYRSQATSAGASARLPLAFTGSAQLSTVTFSSRGESAATLAESKNRQLTLVLGRAFRRHVVRWTERRMNITLMSRREQQRTSELEDAVQWRRFSALGAVRLQHSDGSEQRNTLYCRGALQARLGRVSISGHAEMGNDLVNRTLFATSTYTTTIGTVSVRLMPAWNAEFEAFRNSSTMDLNPASIFVLGAGGVNVSSNLFALNQWNAFFRIRKQFRWGGTVPEGNRDETLGRFVPLVGAVEGFVFELTSTGRGVPASGVPVVLDDGAAAETDAQGRFRFPDVPEGQHTVALSARTLPAEFDPGPASRVPVTVKPRTIARADLEVARLSAVTGRVEAAAGVPVENVIVRLAPSGRYTSTDAQGNFSFHNLREGRYEVTLDAESLAPDVVVKAPAALPLEVSLDREAPELVFQLEMHKREKPVRRIELH